MGNMIDIAIVKDGKKSEVQGSLYNWIKGKDSYIKLNECVVEQQDNAVVILFNHDSCMEGNGFSYFFSSETTGVVLSIYVYDSDYWGYTLYDNGKEVDMFCTRPYWSLSNPSLEELQKYSGNSVVLSKYFNVEEDSIKNYLVSWPEETEGQGKAYPDDKHSQEDWQILDFMEKLGYQYPEEEEGFPDYFDDFSREYVSNDNETTSNGGTSKSSGFMLIAMGIIFLLAIVFTKEFLLFVLLFGITGSILLSVGGWLLYRGFQSDRLD
ncbi:hypothetical protein [Enterococcus sp. BWR-S5]|uniref:hypothetical protein n=1 Tax=Enterococcus sp. BWR-S5 TaxID=2787714 RepID=UPI00192339B8|nr:hypothetical protein [Enterococcus sp. BWR-S5]MBL1225866.1 hypothetical protein [Enterococcus sp. BWR-S5]